MCCLMSQAEMWIRGRLRDLRDSANVQRCLQKDWDEACQTLQRDLKDFENTLIRLNQVRREMDLHLHMMNPSLSSGLMNDKTFTYIQNIFIVFLKAFSEIFELTNMTQYFPNTNAKFVLCPS